MIIKATTLYFQDTFRKTVAKLFASFLNKMALTLIILLSLVVVQKFENAKEGTFFIINIYCITNNCSIT